MILSVSVCVCVRVWKRRWYQIMKGREQQIKLYVFEDFKRNFVKLFLGQLISHVKRML